ncbi:sigma-70 family RNA polymerase sigma factor [Corynebacterium sp. 153RC1]|uniref:sigma-70 family RNA polymerase sigma factor n=1 Tax=unclassified Corynebacterium TaxID=2624378 RepID=UPI00211C1750|nr:MULTISPECIES: sigma-70 family RNA polymerase sigma factor [unclassified Corynebacterium]MCQ9352988.1 sigma-70 family RNA polymerase sigma factor [Corynebacterium sp. 209RC1]MCQ9355174.1 sigma-70 family RNA polymerase sigma factor [Corynebacterium sp. 1222RC1]MCQ9357299.1 sigma-70 family RNA polymerase sigma factor [Corynebacterium sp. 122RC1]MCQ9359475.1 sigma-70 family RNA polymerase sigma factor [Corynebacterium sp. 142RC1]MCQ9361725.1 sigma-70 family RNA polymerase sigma factor [Coryneba
MAGNASTLHNYITVKLAFEVTVAADARRATRDTSFRISQSEAEDWIEGDYQSRRAQAEDPGTVERRSLSEILEELNASERSTSRRWRTHTAFLSVDDNDPSDDDIESGQVGLRAASGYRDGIFTSTTPDDATDAWATSFVVRQALSALSERERQVVLASRIYGLSQRDIAAVLGVSQPMVKKIRDRAEKKLRDLLSGPGVIN